MSWIDAARALDLPSVVDALGLERRGTNAGPCPGCGAERTSTDPRPPLRLSASGGWWCVSCDRKGDGLALVALAVTGDVRPDREGWATVRDWYAHRGWVDGEGSTDHRPAPRRATAPRDVPPVRLPVAEVAALWRSTVPVFDDPRVAAWIRRRWPQWADAVDRVAMADISRALPATSECPPWAWRESRPWALGWPLLTPCYDHTGALVALRARSVHADSDGPKTVSPIGAGACKGAVYADPIGVDVLRTGGRTAPTGAWDGRVLVLEGEATLLHYAIHPQWMRENIDCAHVPAFPRPALLAVWAGGWSAMHAARLRQVGAKHVVVATDDDEKGDEYANLILSTCKRVELPAVRVGKG